MIRLCFTQSGSWGVVMISAIALASVPVTAEAQACAEGRVSSAETAGRCCWPAQVWSDTSRSCEGTPSCPAPWVAHGETCAAPMITPSSLTATPAPERAPIVLDTERPPARATVYVPPPQTTAELTLVEPAEEVRRPRYIAYGTTGVFTSWTATSAIAPLLAIFGLGQNLGFYALQAIPVVGPLLAPFAAQSGTSGFW